MNRRSMGYIAFCIWFIVFNALNLIPALVFVGAVPVMAIAGIIIGIVMLIGR